MKGIEYRFNPAGTKTECIIIENDGEYAEINDLTVKPFGEMTREEIIERIGEAGIVGMGGAGFPTRVKLSPKEDVYKRQEETISCVVLLFWHI